ncbi:leucine-rich repeat-containing protein 73-like [Clavelina lepadiformis]|uniref:leucine-rich repeat-containing protein 73-like n=1 Tax=Clavelina lepadiformis TaxID=159417 RepID=UPI004042174F
MVSGTIQITGEKLSTSEVKEICRSLKDHTLVLLSLRGCEINYDNFRRLMKAVGKTKSLRQLNLNLGAVADVEFASLLSVALMTNRSIRSLYMHGCPLGEKGVKALMKSLSMHPSIVDLDLGDCLLTDASIKMICNLLPPDGAKHGLHELVLSANPAVTSRGWSRLFCAISASSCLKSLTLDYNPLIGDGGAKLLAVAVAGNRTLKTVDLEGCGLTNEAAQVFIDMLESYPTPLRTLVLAGNKISAKLQEDVANCLQDSSDEDD